MIMVQLPGFEPGSRTWQARVLPDCTITATIMGTEFGY